MACPHATTAAAYIKSFQPTWSPAAIKLALMTGNIYIMYSPIMITITIAYSLPFGVLFAAVPMSAEKNVEAEFAYGAGNINPLKAPYPGLIYDIDELDYIKFLCGEDQYNTSLLQIFTKDNSTCSETTNGTVFDLNYPSFALSISPSESISQVFNRTVTNVGSPTSTYKAIVTTPLGLTIKVVREIYKKKKKTLVTPDKRGAPRLEQGESGEKRRNSETLNEGINEEITL
jgi:hypothetical protein